MRATELTEQSLKALSEVEADEPVVVSLFLNLDPSLVATGQARSSQITSVLARLDGLLRESGLSEDALEALEVDRARIEDYLREDALDVDGAAGLAVYSASALDEYRAIKLLEPIETAVHVDQRPILEPIMGATDEGDWCVLLATRDSARIFRGGTTSLREIGDVQSKVKNQHAAGGWSQARFERSVEQDVERHLERATELLLSSFKRRPFEHLVVGANNESLRPALEGEAHSYLLERLRGWIDIDEDLASEDEVLEAVRPVMDEQAEREETELLEVFAAAKATGGRAAEGLDLVLAALVERRVETLLIREGAEAPGTKCVTCNWLGGSESTSARSTRPHSTPSTTSSSRRYRPRSNRRRPCASSRRTARASRSRSRSRPSCATERFEDGERVRPSPRSPALSRPCRA
jgi:peptide chain release factor subunit 1